MSITISNMMKKVAESPQTTRTLTPDMSTVKFFVKLKDFQSVSKDVNGSGVKYYPIRRYSEMIGASYRVGYAFEMDKDHPIVSFLVLKYGLVQID